MVKPTLVSFGIIGFLIFLILLSSKQIRQNRGLMGIGTLILFLAIILVAAIAATVLVTSGTNLQQRALITSNEARENVASGLEVVSIRGMDASQSGTPHAITRLSVLSRLIAGSSPLSLNNTIITFDTSYGTQTLTYAGSVSDAVIATGTSEYVVTYVKSGPYYVDGTVNLGDMVRIKFNIDGRLGENMKGRVTIIPRSGSLNQIEFITPDAMMEPEVVLWPTG